MITAPVQTKVARRLRSERGAMLIHVAVSIFILMGFSAFVLDHGVLMLSRGQAQNVADAAAISGATTRAIDEPGLNNPPLQGLTAKTIAQTVDSHSIFGGTPTDTGWGWSGGAICPPGILNSWCVKVDVFRDGEVHAGATRDGSALPVYFATLFGATSQKMQATATAVATPANGTRCMKPWMIPDKWRSFNAPVDTYDPSPMPPAPVPPDTYVAYSDGYSHDQFVPPSGQIVLRVGPNPLEIHSGDLYEYVGATVDSITSCQIVGRILQPSELRVSGATTIDGVDALIASGHVNVIIGTFSPNEFFNLDRTKEPLPVHIINMMNVRITGRNVAGTEIYGVISGAVGEIFDGGFTPAGKFSMIKKVQLVR